MSGEQRLAFKMRVHGYRNLFWQQNANLSQCFWEIFEFMVYATMTGQFYSCGKSGFPLSHTSQLKNHFKREQEVCFTNLACAHIIIWLADIVIETDSVIVIERNTWTLYQGGGGTSIFFCLEVFTSSEVPVSMTVLCNPDLPHTPAAELQEWNSQTC